MEGGRWGFLYRSLVDPKSIVMTRHQTHHAAMIWPSAPQLFMARDMSESLIKLRDCQRLRSRRNNAHADICPNNHSSPAGVSQYRSDDWNLSRAS